MTRLARVVATLTTTLLLGGLAACDSGGGGSDGPVRGDVEPVPLGLTPPTYALAAEDGLHVRIGDAEKVLTGYSEVEWLPDGRALLLRGGRVTGAWNLATLDVHPVRMPDPNRSVTVIATVQPEYGRIGTPYELVVRDLDGVEQWRTELPMVEVPKRDRMDVERLYGSAHTIDGTTFLRWYDNTELEDYDDYGVLRVADDGAEQEQVLEGEPVIALWLAADGSALLATKRVQGDPCGGCQVTQQLIEIDPATGDVLAEHAMPDEYTPDWDVREVDKVGDRIAVRFEETEFGDETGDDWYQRLAQRGTWVLDEDGWSMVPGSDEEISWWQGPEDRILAVPREGGKEYAGFSFDYYWEHDGDRIRLPGRTEADGPGQAFYDATVPGQLLPPQS